MARAYSVDLREKVIFHIMKGCSKREAAGIFNIGEDTIYRWIRQSKTGDLSPQKRVYFPHKVNTEELRAYVAKHPDHTITEIGQALQLGRQTVCNWLKRLSLTRKKRPRAIKNATKKSAPCTKIS